MGDTVVLVPYDEGVAALAAVPEVRAVRYDPDGPLPPEAATAQVPLPPFLASPRVVELVAHLLELRLVQFLTAGAENWVERLPAHVALSDCRGATAARPPSGSSRCCSPSTASCPASSVARTPVGGTSTPPTSWPASACCSSERATSPRTPLPA